MLFLLTMQGVIEERHSLLVVIELECGEDHDILFCTKGVIFCSLKEILAIHSLNDCIFKKPNIPVSYGVGYSSFGIAIAICLICISFLLDHAKTDG